MASDDKDGPQPPDIFVVIGNAVNQAEEDLGNVVSTAGEALGDTIGSAQQASMDLGRAIAMEMATPEAERMFASGEQLVDGVLRIAVDEIQLHTHQDLMAAGLTVIDLADAAGHLPASAFDFFAAAAQVVDGVITTFDALQQSHHDGGGDGGTHQGESPDMTVSYDGRDAHHVHFDPLTATSGDHGYDIHADGHHGGGDYGSGDYGSGDYGAGGDYY